MKDDDDHGRLVGWDFSGNIDIKKYKLKLKTTIYIH
jgi:hypothetical protein